MRTLILALLALALLVGCSSYSVSYDYKVTGVSTAKFPPK